MSAHEHSQALMIPPEHSRSAMITHEHWAWLNEHLWRLMSAHKHSKVCHHSALSTQEPSWHHATICMSFHEGSKGLMRTNELSWALLSAYEHSWAILSAHDCSWVIKCFIQKLKEKFHQIIIGSVIDEMLLLLLLLLVLFLSIPQTFI